VGYFDVQNMGKLVKEIATNHNMKSCMLIVHGLNERKVPIGGMNQTWTEKL